MCKDLKAWLPVSSHSANIVQRNAFRGQSTKYKCLENFSLYGNYKIIQWILGIIISIHMNAGTGRAEAFESSLLCNLRLRTPPSELLWPAVGLPVASRVSVSCLSLCFWYVIVASSCAHAHIHVKVAHARACVSWTGTIFVFLYSWPITNFYGSESPHLHELLWPAIGLPVASYSRKSW